MYAVVYQQTHSALALVGLRLIHILPELLLGPFAGVFVDRWSRKKTLIVSPLVSAVFVALLVFVHPVALIFLVEAAQTIAGMVFEPAVDAAMPNIVEPEQLVQANSLSRIPSTVSILVGGLAGGIVVSSLGAPFAFGLDAVSFLVIAVLVTTVHVREERASPSVASIERELLEGVRYLRERPLVANVVAAGALFVVAPSAMFTLGIVFADERHPEHRHDGVAREFLNRATPGLDRGGHLGEIALQDGPPALRIQALTQGGRSSNVGEEHGHELPLLGTHLGEGMAALRTEASVGRKRRRALRTTLTAEAFHRLYSRRCMKAP